MPSGTSVASPNGIPWDGEVVDPNEKANRLWRMEDGATDGPAVSPRQEIDIVRAFRTGEIQRPRTGGGKTIEDAERWWLSLHEYPRRHGPSDVVLPERGSVDWWYCVYDFVRTLIDGHDRTELEPVAPSWNSDSTRCTSCITNSTGNHHRSPSASTGTAT